MKNKILFLFAALIFMQRQSIFSQQSAVRATADQQLENESESDPYLPNQWNNKKTSNPYYYQRIAGDSATTITTVQVNVDSDGLNIIDDAANEPSMAVDPFNPQSIVIGWRQFDNIGSNFRQAGWGFSTDGGSTWTASKIDPGVFRSDPVLDFDLQGNFYYNSLTPYPDWECDVYKSSDDGATWDAGNYAWGGDKQWMTIDRTTGEGSGNIYAFWTSSYSACYPDNFTRSTDGGESYESCIFVDSDPYYGTLAVNAEGVLYIVGGGDITTLKVIKSENAQTPGSDIIWEEPVNVDLEGSIGGWGSINPEGLLGQAIIDIDVSGGPGHGNVYVLASVMPDTGPDQADVGFSKSTDGGETWSDPIFINDEKGDGYTHWFGTMSVAPNGRIDVIWLDTRDGGGSDSSALYYSYSLDQGETWSVNEKLSESFDPHVGYPMQNKMGDYFDMASDDIGAHLAWANTLNGEQDVYYSYIVPSIPVIVSNQELENNFNLSIAPNPVSGVFMIDGIQEAMQVVISNSFGQVLILLEKDNSVIDISNLPSGIYFVQISNVEGLISILPLIKN